MPENVTKSGLTVVSHWGGSTPPPQVEQAMVSQGMGWGRAFAPGRPLNPFYGSGKPRSHDFQAGYNIQSRPTTRDGRISFDVLKGIIDAWDLARICIRRRINDVRSLDWSIEAAPGVTEDVTTAIEFARLKLRRPEGPGSRLPFRAWLAKYLEDVLRYDAGTLYRRRNRIGEVIGLQVVSGRSVAPLLDDFGDTPEPPAPAYMQYIQGMPWKELTTDDLIYVPMEPQPDSPYGMAPMESILLSANTDLRMQQFFLAQFTAGTIPEGFASTPEGFTPDQIQEWQDYWDALLYGDPERLVQLKWVPSGTKFDWAKDFKFDKEFQLFIMGKVAAAYSVTLNDLGFTDDVNRATGDTQVDVQFRVGTLPLVQHVQDLLTDYLQDDLGLPVAFRMDTGQEKEDRLTTAQADKVYIEAGVFSPDEVREGLGRPIDNERRTPRFVMHSRLGPISLLSIMSSGGRIDGETYGPAEDQGLLPDPENAVAILPEAGTDAAATFLQETNARQEAAREFLHPGSKPHKPVAAPGPSTPATGTPGAGEAVTEALRAALTSGVTSGTGISGNPLHAGSPSAEDDDDLDAALTKALASILKATAPTVAGLAVKAADTGRVLMLQRALTDDDPAAGRIEFPGGHLDDGETPIQGACREWAEEVGCAPPPGVQSGTWQSPNGVYQGIVWVIPSEADLTINLDPEDRHVLNPDDPDHDQIETVMWVDPALLSGNPMVRDDLAADLDAILPVIQAACLPEDVAKGLRSWRRASRERVVKSRGPRLLDATGVPEQVQAVVWPVLQGARSKADVDAAFRRVVKAGGKGRWRDGAPDVPQRAYDLRITDHFAPRIQKALGQMYPPAAIRVAAEAGTLDLMPQADTGPLRDALERLWADAWATGVHGAVLQAGKVRKDDDGPDLPVAETAVDWDSWEPGNLDAAILAADGNFAGVLDQAGVTIRGITGTTVDRLGAALSEGLLNGDSVDTIARSLAGVISDPARAEMVAQTESARLQTDASVQQYAAEGFGGWDWLTTSGACPRCVDREAANPHRIDDDHSPMHPYERCAVAPVWSVE